MAALYRLNSLLPTWEVPNGNRFDCSAGGVPAWWRWLGLFTLASKLAVDLGISNRRRALQRTRLRLVAPKETEMKPSTRDELRGKVHELKGTLKEKVGRLTNDSDLQAEGIGEQIGGKVQKKIGQLRKIIEKP